MEFRTSRLTLLIDPNKKNAFERLCALQDLTTSQVVRQSARNYLGQHGVQHLTRGVSEFPPSPDLPAPRTRPGSPETAPSIARQGTLHPKT
jgi:hypothetical protein